MPTLIIAPAELSAELCYAAEQSRCNLPEGVAAAIAQPGQPGYTERLRQAFHFLRQNDDLRYSSSTKMRLLTTADQLDAGRGVEAPLVLVLERPFTFDPDTEVKSGGLLGVAVVWPGSNKLVMAVHRMFRRARIGATMLSLLNFPGCQYSMTTWVNRRNTTGQHFLLATGWSVSTLNSSGGMCWTRGIDNADGDGVEDGMDPLVRLEAPLTARFDELVQYEDDDF